MAERPAAALRRLGEITGAGSSFGHINFIHKTL